MGPSLRSSVLWSKKLLVVVVVVVVVLTEDAVQHAEQILEVDSPVAIHIEVRIVRTEVTGDGD